MNISHEHKSIWWAPEETDESKLCEIFNNFGFFVENNPKSSIFKLKYDNHISKSDEFPDYDVICSMKNPYHRVFSLFLKYGLNGRTIKKKFLPILREKFNLFIDKTLISEKLRVRPLFLYPNRPSEFMYFEKWVFDDKMPDKLVRIENINEDLSKIEFINQKINVLQPNKVDLYDYRLMYDFKTAKKVYHFYKKHFYLGEYDPFSFTYDKLKIEDKISFLHDTL